MLKKAPTQTLAHKRGLRTIEEDIPNRITVYLEQTGEGEATTSMTQ